MKQELEKRAAPLEHAVNIPSGLSSNKMHNPTEHFKNPGSVLITLI